MIHPWWHIQGNSGTVEGLPVIDRNSKTFFYPPFLHVFIAGFMFFLPTGIATIISISLIYSLSVPATYLLSRSYGKGRKASLTGAGVTGASITLLHSQLMGFWSFAAAFILGVASFSFYRFHRKEGDRKYLAAYIVTGLFTVLTHWVFGAFIIGMPLLDGLLEEKSIDWKIPGLAFLTVLPFYLAFFATSSIGSYITTSFDKLYPSIMPLLAVSGLLTSRGSHRTIDLFTAGSLAGILAYYLGVPMPFGGMIQFALPLLAGFYISVLHDQVKDEELRKAFTVLVSLLMVLGFISQITIGHGSSRALTEKEFHQLINARDDIPRDKIVAGPELGTWVTLASKDQRIVSPYADFNTSQLDTEKFHILLSGDRERP